jgi:hypothetical protein
MNIDIRWDNQNHKALICEFKGDWTWHECREAMQVMVYMQDGSGMTVHHIYDLSNSTLSTRACINRLQKLLKLEISPAPERIVIVDKAIRLHTIENMLGGMVQSWGKVHFAEDLSDARSVLQTNDIPQ